MKLGEQLVSRRRFLQGVAGGIGTAAVLAPQLAAAEEPPVGSVSTYQQRGGTVGLEYEDTDEIFDVFKTSLGNGRFAHTHQPAETAAPKTKEEAASTYGSGTYSSNPDNWNIFPFNNGRTIGSGMNEDPTGKHHRIRTRGHVIEGYWNVLQYPGNVPFFQGGKRAVGFVVDGTVVTKLDVRGATIWKGQGVSKELTWRQVSIKEAGPVAQGGQPGALLIPIGFAPACPPLGPVEIMKTPELAAQRYGKDVWSQDPGNWKVSFNQTGVLGLHLLPDPSGAHTRIGGLYGIAMDGYMDVQADLENPYFQEGRRPIAFVADGTTVPELDVRSVTLWHVRAPQGWPEDRPTTMNRLWGQLIARKTQPFDQGGQPGITILPFGFKPNGEICKVDP